MSPFKKWVYQRFVRSAKEGFVYFWKDVSSIATEMHYPHLPLRYFRHPNGCSAQECIAAKPIQAIIDKLGNFDTNLNLYIYFLLIIINFWFSSQFQVTKFIISL